jgi:UDP-N-acetylmuramate dehydrogenase
MDDKLKLLKAELGEERIKLDEKVADHTFSKLGGLAKFFYIATTERELIHVLDTAMSLRIPYLLIGAGTKLLVSDKGFEGLVIKNRVSNVKISGVKGKVGKDGIGVEEALVEVESGASLLKINDFLKEQKLEQLLDLSSENATLGGAIFLDINLLKFVQKVKVWEKGQVSTEDVDMIRQGVDVVLSAILRVRAAE